MTCSSGQDAKRRLRVVLCDRDGREFLPERVHAHPRCRASSFNRLWVSLNRRHSRGRHPLFLHSQFKYVVVGLDGQIRTPEIIRAYLTSCPLLKSEDTGLLLVALILSLVALVPIGV